MFNINTFLFVSIAVFSIILAAPVAMPLLENLLTSMKLMPQPY